MPGLKTSEKVVTLAASLIRTTPDCGLQLAWSPDGDKLAVASATGPFQVIDPQTGQVFAQWSEHEKGNLGLAWSHDGTRIATAGQDGRVRLFDGGNLSQKAEFSAGADWVGHLAFSGDSKFLAVGAGKEVQIFDQEGNPLQKFEPCPSTVSGLAWRSDSKGVWASFYGGVNLFNLEKGAPARRLKWKGSLVSMKLSPDAKHIACGCQDGAVHVWIVASSKDMEMSGYPLKVKELAWSPDSRYLATGGGPEPIIWDFSGKGPQGSKPIVLEGQPGPLTDLEFHPWLNVLAAGDRTGVMTFWKIQGKQAIPLAVAARDSSVERLSWNPKGQLLASLHVSGELCVWSPPGWE